MFALCSIYVPIHDETAEVACHGEAARGRPRPERENPREKIRERKRKTERSPWPSARRTAFGRAAVGPGNGPDLNVGSPGAGVEFVADT